jgi:C-terminal processing protease CtpA/Prc
MSTKFLRGLIGLMGATLVVCGFVLVLDKRALDHLRDDNRHLRDEVQAITPLKTEISALRRAQVDADELERLRKQTQEIHRLRAQYREFQQLQQEHAALQKEHEQLKALHQQLADQQQTLRSQFQSIAAAGANRQNQAATTPSGAWLGVSIQSLAESPQVRSQNPGVTQGVVVAAVIPDTPAEQSGLQPGDIVTAIDNEKVTTAAQLRETMATKQVGQRLIVDVYRGGMVYRVGVVAAPIPLQ